MLYILALMGSIRNDIVYIDRQSAARINLHVYYCLTLLQVHSAICLTAYYLYFFIAWLTKCVLNI